MNRDTSAKKLAVVDHDFTKFSLISSVTFLIDIPKNIADESFYSGMIFVGLKENAFEPLSPIHHVTELNVVLNSLDDKQQILLINVHGWGTGSSALLFVRSDWLD